MKAIDFFKLMSLFGSCLLYHNCTETTTTVKSTYNYIAPIYSNIKIISGDSIRFVLSGNTYNDIKSFNYFMHNGKAFISFYDARSTSINIYDFLSRQRIIKIKVKKWIKDQPLYKTSIFVKNFDSIFITNQTTLYIYDSTGYLKKNILFNKKAEKYAFFDNLQPPVLLANKLYMGIRPYVSETSFDALKGWNLIYEFELTQSTKHLYYQLPETYKKNLYGYQFLNYSYCYNPKGNFVFSFPADTNIYETNLIDYHIAYYGKSRFQTSNIQSVQKEIIKDGNAYREFRLRDSYGSIYYDSYNKRYLRLARQKISESEYKAKDPIKRQSVIIFDEHFKIIGEPVINGDISFSSIFITADGHMYARVNPRDEYALNFVKLTYEELESRNKLLTKK